MGKMVIRYKIFPDDISIDLQSLYNEIKQKLEGKAEIGQFKSEPIAFGLNAMILDVRMDDKANVDVIESVIKGIKNVGELEAIASTKV
ncbi:MAG: elongation factor 1-beta [Nitrososphaeria archaeon]|jgi:elongation factor 1-beta